MFRNLILTQVSEFCSNFQIANFICKILPSTEYNFVFEIYLFSQLLLRTMKEPFIHFIYFMSNILQNIFRTCH